MRVSEITYLTTTVESARAFLQERGILRSTPPECRQCGGRMTIVKDVHRGDGAIFRCPKHKSVKLSIRDRSFLFDSSLSLQNFIFIVYEWACKTPLGKVIEKTGHSSAIIVQWYLYLRNACSSYMLNNSNRIGGIGHVVEIDESLISKRKYNRGRLVSERWVFGGIDTTTHLGFIRFVEDRSARTLLPILKEYVLPGTEIHSDGWMAYNGIAEIDVEPRFQHFVVNHSQNFVDPMTGACTNHVERMWAEAKKVFKAMNGTSADMVDGYLDEFMWRQMRGRSIGEAFNNILRDVGEWHNPNI